jgi:hypothetical protein
VCLCGRAASTQWASVRVSACEMQTSGLSLKRGFCIPSSTRNIRKLTNPYAYPNVITRNELLKWPSICVSLHMNCKPVAQAKNEDSASIIHQERPKINKSSRLPQVVTRNETTMFSLQCITQKWVFKAEQSRRLPNSNSRIFRSTELNCYSLQLKLRMKLSQLIGIFMLGTGIMASPAGLSKREDRCYPLYAIFPVHCNVAWKDPAFYKQQRGLRFK